MGSCAIRALTGRAGVNRGPELRDLFLLDSWWPQAETGWTRKGLCGVMTG